MWAFSQQAIQERFQRNLSFFQQNMPELFNVLKEVRFERLTLSVSEEQQRWDIFDGQRSLYLGDGEKYVDEEVAAFGDIFPVNAPIRTLEPISRNDYGGPRFFHHHLNQTMRQMDYQHMDKHHHYLPDFIPIIVFTNIGSGLHIQRYLEQRDCRIVLIADHSPESLLMSLYMTDWYDIIPRFTRDQGRFFNFILVQTDDDEKFFQGMWNELSHYIPLFPTMNVFYNHLKSAFYDRIIQRVQAEFKVFITAWGFYDDEANQLNNTLHSLRNLIPVLPKALPQSLLHWVDEKPAVIVGAGPSLNQRIDWIKANRDRIFLFSAGTALSVLKHHDIVPDLHVEIESDYATVLHLSHTLDENYQVPLLAGAVQLNPKVFELASHAFMYFKDSTSLHAMFGDQCAAQLHGMTPTCTNAATGLAIQLGFKKVFLFGMDFGYRDVKHSHANGSVYFDAKAPKHLQDIATQRTAQMRVRSIDNEDLITEPIYNAARDRVEKLLALHQQRCSVYNCSMGAHIEYTEVIREQAEFEASLGESFNQNDYRQTLLAETVIIMPTEIENGLKKGSDFLQAACQLVKDELMKMPDDRGALIISLLNLSRRLQRHYFQTRNSMYFLIRGTFWHYFNAALTAAFTTPDEEVANRNLAIWRQRFIDLVDKLPEHYDWVGQRDLSIEEDTWLDKRITEMVDDPFYQQQFASPFNTDNLQ
ncbi:motility associated factor glycosyltransferase family protein [Saccharospirillum mangrovi]|uniref:motility associated factor glycosyltransferase family protein n=1 Tax=Saccharospirillum mangrovi TaxID=2161747 RepID=UPI000D3CC056|nr:6-hydroxymethylpterin diphosphokinase MptE-like protein [Saccharospirillum mangrovi]